MSENIIERKDRKTSLGDNHTKEFELKDKNYYSFLSDKSIQKTK